MSYAVSGILRRLSHEPPRGSSSSTHPQQNTSSSGTTSLSQSVESMEGVYTPPRRTASPFQPPPLTPLTLSGYSTGTSPSGRLLTKALAEEIRLLMPPRLQLVDQWSLAYSLEQNGVSLATLYEKSNEYRGKRGGFILVVRDGLEGVCRPSRLGYSECSVVPQTFGAYLSDAPHPSSHFFGTGECFLWRAHMLSSTPNLSLLPPPPSADTTHAQRMTTVAGLRGPDTLSAPLTSGRASRSGTATPERIRFKAFPYSGVNDYMIFCEQDYLSVGGGYVPHPQADG